MPNNTVDHMADTLGRVLVTCRPEESSDHGGSPNEGPCEKTKIYICTIASYILVQY